VPSSSSASSTACTPARGVRLKRVAMASAGSGWWASALRTAATCSRVIGVRPRYSLIAIRSIEPIQNRERRADVTCRRNGAKVILRIPCGQRLRAEFFDQLVHVSPTGTLEPVDDRHNGATA